MYQTLLSLMADSDLLVRLTAVSNLKTCVDDWDFEPHVFTPYFSQTVGLFTRLVTDCEEVENKIKVLSCLAVIVERLEGGIRPFAIKIVEMLPGLWDMCGEEHLFRGAIICILKSLVVALGEESEGLHEIVCGVLKGAVDTSQPGHVYLIDDGLELWLAVIQNAKTLTPSLEHLLTFCNVLLDYGSDNLKQVLRIIESYVLLAPVTVLQGYSVVFMEKLVLLIGNLKPEAMTSILACVDGMLQGAETGDCIMPVLSCMTGFVGKIVEILLADTEMSYLTAR